MVKSSSLKGQAVRRGSLLLCSLRHCLHTFVYRLSGTASKPNCNATSFVWADRWFAPVSRSTAHWLRSTSAFHAR
nr:MAG TPA: hypothetical protein [Caudoviricetes sp.]